MAKNSRDPVAAIAGPKRLEERDCRVAHGLLAGVLGDPDDRARAD